MTSDTWFGKVMPICASYSVVSSCSDMEVANFARTCLCFPLLVTWLAMFCSILIMTPWPVFGRENFGSWVCLFDTPCT